MFLKTGCGCIVMVTNMSSGSKADWLIRTIDYCGDSEGARIGVECKLGDRILHINIENFSFMTPEESIYLWRELASLVTDGYRYRELSVHLKLAMAPL
jgi:hypothetical protein